MNDSRGSIWRKWDFHIHTPASLDWLDGPTFRSLSSDEQRSELAGTCLRALGASEADAFVIMDHWTFDGFIRLRRHPLWPSLTKEKVIFPGVEVRCVAPTKKRLNLHVVLSDELTDLQLNEFLRKLEIPHVRRPPSEEAFLEIGRSLGDDDLEALGRSPADRSNTETMLRAGYDRAEVDFDVLAKAVKESNGSALLYVPFSPEGGMEHNFDWKKHPLPARSVLEQAALLEARNETTALAIQGVQTARNSGFFENMQRKLGRPKPAVSGSDAHFASEYGSARTTWVKADLTFRGLLQASVEPANRVCSYRDVPEEVARFQSDKTKYIERIVIRRSNKSTFDEPWFDVDLALNPGLVAIIGNKGSGKSALADSLALLGNTDRPQDRFSFLNGAKFKRKGDNKAAHFEATITWASGKTNTKSLDADLEASDPVLVQYLPQAYLEEVCNEIAFSRDSLFSRELKGVIYSHIPEEERLDTTSFDELMQLHGEQAQSALGELRAQLASLNSRIRNLERAGSDEEKKRLERLIKQRQDELVAHDASKPEELPKPVPVEADDSLAPVLERLEALQARKAELEGEIEAKRQQVSDLLRKKELLRKARYGIEGFEEHYEEVLAVVGEAAQVLGVEPTDLLHATVDYGRIDAESQRCDDDLEALRAALDQGGELTLDLHRTTEALAATSEALEGPQRAYAERQALLERWEASRRRILGDARQEGSLLYAQRMLDQLEGIPAQLRELRDSRMEFVDQLFHNLDAVREAYAGMTAHVQKAVEAHPDVSAEIDLAFSVDIVERGFVDGFFERVGQRARSAFSGREDGRQFLRDMLDRHNLSRREGVRGLLEELESALLSYDRDGKAHPVDLEQVVRAGHTVVELYDYVFGLTYLVPEFTLRLGEKPLERLSPGERGALLLVFYLLLDRSTVPLIVDQPEENLDNQTVYRLLAPCLRSARSRRQVVVVTHNANLAVACDAEQIITASHDSKRRRIEYSSGAIENPRFNQSIVDVLEGTMPAFRNRGAKYFGQGPER